MPSFLRTACKSSSTGQTESIPARDGSRLQRLVALPARSRDLQWSKDGRRLRFTLNDRSGEGSSIWEDLADGGNLHAVDLNLPVPGPAYSGRWSADGRYFLFRLRAGWDSKHLGIARGPSRLAAESNYGGPIAGAAPSVFVWSGNEHLEVARYFPDSGRILPLLPGSRPRGWLFRRPGIG